MITNLLNFFLTKYSSVSLSITENQIGHVGMMSQVSLFIRWRYITLSESE